MNLRSVDLNLLVVLGVRLEEAHVSRAALRLGMSQPAVSNALERCRGLFDDAILERSGTEMHLTAKAERLREPVAALLADAGAIFGIQQPPLSELRGAVRLTMADILNTVAGACSCCFRNGIGARDRPDLSALGVSWRCSGCAYGGRSDVVVAVLSDLVGSDLHVEALLRQKYVVLMRQDHPASESFDLDAWLAWPHVVVSASSRSVGALDAPLAHIGRERRVGVVVPNFLVVGDLLRAANMMAMLPELCARPRWSEGLVIRPPAIAIDGLTLKLAWHRRRGDRRVTQFIADQIRSALERLTPAHLVSDNVTANRSGGNH
jgi:DNA-binding transcriptional LysR family regulator